MCQRFGRVGGSEAHRCGMDDLLALAAPVSTVPPSPSPLEGKPEPVPGGGHKSEAVYGGHG
jgi:hypothetical protein